MATLAEVFASVEVSQSDAILILNELLENNYDKSPTLVESLNSAIADIVSPPVNDTKATTSTSTTTKASTSS
jgi:hypothetical protein